MRLRIRSHSSVYPGVSYTLTLPRRLVLRLRNANKHFWHRCRGRLLLTFEPVYPRIYLFLFYSTITPVTLFEISLFVFFLPLPPLPMEGYPCKHLPPSRSEPSEPSSSRPTLTSGCRIHPSLMKLIQDLSFSGLSHESPFDHVRDYERLIET